MMNKNLTLLLLFFGLFTSPWIYGQNLITTTYPGAGWSGGDDNDPSGTANNPTVVACPGGGVETWINFDGVAGNNASQEGGSAIGALHTENITYTFPATLAAGDYIIYYEQANAGLVECDGTIRNGTGRWRFDLGTGLSNGQQVAASTSGTMEWSKSSITITAGAITTLTIQARRVGNLASAGGNPYMQIDNIIMVAVPTAPCEFVNLGSEALNECYGLPPVEVCYPLNTACADIKPGVPNTNPVSCDIDAGDPTAVITIPAFDCGSVTTISFDTPILPANPRVLYHYWGNCAPLSPSMPENISPKSNGYIQQMFCETDAFGLPAFPGGLSNENGIIDFLPEESEDVGSNGFAEIGTSCDGGGTGTDEKEAELIQLDFWMAVPDIQSQVGFRFSTNNREDAGSFFVGADLSNMCEVAYFTDGQNHDALTDQLTGTFNINGQLSGTCGLLWMRVRIYINDIADQFEVNPEINAGNGWVGIDQLLIEPALTADDNTVPTVVITTVCGYSTVVGVDEFLYDAAGTWDPYGCNPVAKSTDVGICGAMCPVVNPIDVMDAVCDGMLGSTISDWMTNVEANAANIAAITNANTAAAIVYSLDAAPTEATPPIAGTADASHDGTSCMDNTETTYAYLLCFGADNTVGGGDDIYLLIGTHVLTVYPPAEQPVDGIATCVNTPVGACMTDVFGAVAVNPIGGAAIANWDGTSYTAQTGDLAGSVDIVVTTANGCIATFTITTPACPTTSNCDASNGTLIIGN